MTVNIIRQTLSLALAHLIIFLCSYAAMQLYSYTAIPMHQRTYAPTHQFTYKFH